MISNPKHSQRHFNFTDEHRNDLASIATGCMPIVCHFIYKLTVSKNNVDIL